MDSALTGQQIVYAANDWRTDNRTSSHHIASYLSRNNKILYLQAAGQRTPRLSGRDMKRAASRLQKTFDRPTEVQQNIWLFSPFILPFHMYRWVQRVNPWLLKRSISRACAVLGFENPILWLTVPHYASVIGAFRTKGTVYYCTDDFASFPKINREAIQRMEQRVLSRANIVFAVSEPLFESKRRFNDKTYLSPHGVDTTHFGKASAAATEVPADIAGIRKPIAGFFGLIEEWFDLQLLDFCARKHEDISFVLIGRTAQDVTALARRPNVHFLGPKPYELLPNYLKAFDVGLIPFRMADTARYSNPLKFKEYLAGGKPVVSVRIAALESYRDIGYLADTYEDFADAVARSIAEDTPQKADLRMAAMLEESWDAKAATICERVRDHIPGA